MGYLRNCSFPKINSTNARTGDHVHFPRLILVRNCYKPDVEPFDVLVAGDSESLPDNDAIFEAAKKFKVGEVVFYYSWTVYDGPSYSHMVYGFQTPLMKKKVIIKR